MLSIHRAEVYLRPYATIFHARAFFTAYVLDACRWHMNAHKVEWGWVKYKVGGGKVRSAGRFVIYICGKCE